MCQQHQCPELKLSLWPCLRTEHILSCVRREREVCGYSRVEMMPNKGTWFHQNSPRSEFSQLATLEEEEEEEETVPLGPA